MKRKSLFQIVLLCFFLIVFCLSCFGLWFSTLDYSKAKETYESLGNYVELVTVQSEGSLQTEDTAMYQIDWNALKEINPDVVGWIIIPGTGIDYPIVQALDNATYLRTSFDGTQNLCGTIFMDCRNFSDFSDANTILYGHNMRDGSMFAILNDYMENPDLFYNNNELWILTQQWQRKYHIISAHLTTDGSESYTYQFAEGGYERHVAREMEASIYQGETYSTTLPMLTLSTCHGSGSKERAVLIAQPVFEIITNDGWGESMNETDF